MEASKTMFLGLVSSRKPIGRPLSTSLLAGESSYFRGCLFVTEDIIRKPVVLQTSGDFWVCSLRPSCLLIIVLVFVF